MKVFTLNLIFIIIFSFNCNAQKKETCEDTEDSLVELNTITINKCDIEEEKTKTRKIVANTSSRKKNNRISHYVRKNSKPISKTKRQNIKSSISKEVIFSVVEKIPLFKNCRNTKDRKCFNKEFYTHFSKNFNPERASEEGINSKVFLQFTIDIKGNTANILIKCHNKSKNLEEEIKRVVKKLPTFKPAIHKGFPVNVKHSLPLNLTSY